MKRDSSTLYDDEIDLSEIIKTLWNEKILILSISLIFMVAGYVYSILQDKIYKTEITIREVPLYLFETYEPYFNVNPTQISIANQFNKEFNLNLLSHDNLVQFVESNNTINDFKNHLKEKNISVEKYFRPQFDTRKFNAVIDKKNNIINNKYSLTFSQILPGESFLNNYIIFVHQQTIKLLKKQLEQKIILQITVHQQNLEISNKINLENPILQSIGQGLSEANKVVVVNNEQNVLFYKGSKVLTQEITYLNKLLNETKNLTFDYNPILEQASNRLLITMLPEITAAIAFVLGLFFSLMVVFIKSLLRR